MKWYEFHCTVFTFNFPYLPSKRCKTRSEMRKTQIATATTTRESINVFEPDINPVRDRHTQFLQTFFAFHWFASKILNFVADTFYVSVSVRTRDFIVDVRIFLLLHGFPFPLIVCWFLVFFGVDFSRSLQRDTRPVTDRIIKCVVIEGKMLWDKRIEQQRMHRLSHWRVKKSSSSNSCNPLPIFCGIEQFVAFWICGGWRDCRA